MTARGIHFALSPEDRERIVSASDADTLVNLLTDEIEESYLASDEWFFESDRAWDPLHRCLGNGDLVYEAGPAPLSLAILGGRALDAGNDFTACLIEPDQVKIVAPALSRLTRTWMHQRYFALDAKRCGYPLTHEGFEYAWACFQGMPEFFLRAARAGRAVVFTTDA